MAIKLNIFCALKIIKIDVRFNRFGIQFRSLQIKNNHSNLIPQPKTIDWGIKYDIESRHS